MKKKASTYLLDILFMTAGACIYATTVNCFTAPNNIAPGGLTGVATLLNYMFGTPIGTLILVLNIPIIIWAVIEIGYKLVLKTSFAILLSSVTIDLFAMFMPVYKGEPLLVAIFAGVLEGVGLALTFMRGATTGGTDMIARLVGRRMRHLSMGKLMLFIDGIVIVASGFVFKSIESAMYACIVVFVATSIIDAILYGTDAGTGKLFFVFSRKARDIGDKIMSEMDRGVTYLKSLGGFSKEDGEVLLCAVRRFEIFKIHEIIREIDKEAFVIVGDAGEITGEGFKNAKPDDTTLREIISKISKKGKAKKGAKNEAAGNISEKNE